MSENTVKPTITVWSDYVCPWCYVGLTEVENLRSTWDFTIEWKPFLLRPETPDEGMELPAYIREKMGELPLTGSDVDAILVRAKERAVLASRDLDVQVGDLEQAVQSFIDPLDPDLLALQELAAVLACSDRRYLPDRYKDADRAKLLDEFARLKLRAGRR